VRDFSTPPQVTERVTVRVEAPRVTTSVTVSSADTSVRQTYALKADASWTWEDLRDYVVTQIEQRFGAFPRNTNAETGIFKGFMARHGADAVRIARYAFEDRKGIWVKAPVKIGRFMKDSDEYFAVPILERLRQTVG
jgi:hypothetical protein